MKASIHTIELTKEKGTWMAMTHWIEECDKTRASPIKYGDSKKEATDKLKKLLEKRGHTVMD